MNDSQAMKFYAERCWKEYPNALVFFRLNGVYGDHRMKGPETRGTELMSESAADARMKEAIRAGRKVLVCEKLPKDEPSTAPA